MTIFHVLKYPPSEAVRRYTWTIDKWEDIFPTEIAELLRNRLSIGRTEPNGRVRAIPPSEYEECITKVLLEYEGPL